MYWLLTLVIAGLLAPPSITREMVPHIPNLGRDPNSKFKVQFLPRVYHFHTIINLKNLKSNHHKSGTVCTCDGGYRKGPGLGGSAWGLSLKHHLVLRGEPRRPAWPGAVQKEMVGRRRALGRADGPAVCSEGTEALEFCLMFAFGEAH